MTPKTRSHNGWTWTGITVAGKWRFRKGAAGKTTTVDIARTLIAGEVEAALDQHDASPAKPAPGAAT